MKLKTEKTLSTIILAIIGFLFLWPLLWIVFASFDAGAPLSVRLPEDFTWANYTKVLSDPMNIQSFANSFIISFSQASIVVIMSILAAYPLSRYSLKHENTILYSMLFLTGLPITAIMVPVYILFFQFKFTN
jgi:multiple sugar transport system permease protein